MKLIKFLKVLLNGNYICLFVHNEIYFIILIVIIIIFFLKIQYYEKKKIKINKKLIFTVTNNFNKKN